MFVEVERTESKTKIKTKQVKKNVNAFQPKNSRNCFID